MSEQSAVVEATPTEAPDVFKGESPTLAEFNKYREEGVVAERFKTAEEAAPAPAITEPEIEGESETPPQQEKTERKPKLTAAERIEEIRTKAEKTIRDIRRGAGLPDEEVAASSPAKPEPVVRQEPPPTRIKPTPEGNGPDGKPYETYEDFVEDLADWRSEQREAKNKREVAMQAQAESLQTKIGEARERYENFDQVTKPFVDEFVADQKIAQAVKSMVDDSEVFADLAFVLAGDDKFLEMARNQPGKALRHIAKVEGLIEAELANAATTARGEDGKFVSPVKPTPKAPKPPSTVGGASAKAFDVSDDSLSPEEWMRQRNQQVARTA